MIGSEHTRSDADHLVLVVTAVAGIGLGIGTFVSDCAANGTSVVEKIVTGPTHLPRCPTRSTLGSPNKDRDHYQRLTDTATSGTPEQGRHR
jgi:hypothetical protein